jgi:metallo-beta-lactamase class B
VTTVKDRTREYRVVFAASTSVNPGTRLVKNPSYPGILADFRKALAVLDSLKPDIFVSAHAGFFDLKKKRQRMTADDPGAAFVDPEGYRTLIASRKRTFEETVAREKRSGQ